MKKNTLFWITGIVLVAVLLLFVPSMLIFGRGNLMHDSGMMGDYGNSELGSNMMGDYGNSGPGSNMMGDYNHSGSSMMGGGWMAFGWILPVVILILIIGVGVWLGNLLSNRTLSRSKSLSGTCSNCNEPAQASWKTCPYCSTTL
ncbi:MAG: hypothetical protein HN392_13580 [Anaerolineae bacterium]|nr:hypothetical protein [Anaerolineae bacterium]MBT7075838.1 hypothetical protein [Anaerolineae bacterium]MBT7782434.1 hypothetical protein [Anaerolineae bacterium]